MALVNQGFPVLAFAQHDEAYASIVELAERFAVRGSTVLLAGGPAANGTVALPAVTTHPAIEPILMIQSFYRMAAELAVARGFDPDRPPHLNKITSTV
jgi:glucosamine--fructose-6-phosphate aminotransferase (isomerizing)